MNVVSLIAFACHLSQATQTIDPIKSIDDKLIGNMYTASFYMDYGGAIEEVSLRKSANGFSYSTLVLSRAFRESERQKTGFSMGGLRMIVDLTDGRTILINQDGTFLFRGKNGKSLGYYMMGRLYYMQLAVAVELFLSRIDRK